MIRTHQVGSTLHIALSGQLSLSALYDLTAILIQVADSCEEYCIDMSEAVTISDGALAALAMFVRHARRMGRRTHLTGCHWRFARRLALLPTLHELFEQTPSAGALPQPGWALSTTGPRQDSATKHSCPHTDFLPDNVGQAASKTTWH